MIKAKEFRLRVAKAPETAIIQHLLDSLSLSRYGESSGELSSVMILNPMAGNSLGKAIGQDSKHHNE
jgi:hypothetical protein